MVSVGCRPRTAGDSQHSAELSPLPSPVDIPLDVAAKWRHLTSWLRIGSLIDSQLAVCVCVCGPSSLQLFDHYQRRRNQKFISGGRVPVFPLLSSLSFLSFFPSLLPFLVSTLWAIPQMQLKYLVKRYSFLSGENDTCSHQTRFTRL